MDSQEPGFWTEYSSSRSSWVQQIIVFMIPYLALPKDTLGSFSSTTNCWIAFVTLPSLLVLSETQGHTVRWKATISEVKRS